MDNFDKAKKVLQYDRILQMLADCSSTEGAAEVSLSLSPSYDYDKVCALQRETTDARRLYVTKGEPSFGRIRDILPLLDRADKGAVLSQRELLDVANLLRTTRGVLDYYKTEKKYDTVLDEVFERLLPDRPLEQSITKAIISEDTIADEASNELYDIRRKVRQMNNKIRESLQKYVAGGVYSKYLQENIITLRNGRYVIPVKAEYKNEIKGLVHDTSSSGATLFIEPIAAVDANNELKVLERAEENEIERILYELSGKVSSSSGIMRLDYYNLTYLSAVYARAKLSVQMDAFEPHLTKKRALRLNKARHPLLDREKVVPITLYLGGEFDTLVITGPNTGGKTVSEKTLGLLIMMAQSGLHIPAAEDSELCIFEGILADIGDEQSIEQSLSTFSAHMVNIVDMLNKVTPGMLVIFDELGAGTDPVEGAALAVSILEAVRENGAMCVATTHYAELKAYAIETDGVSNASCEFDIETLKPTYRLIIGAPGRSNAFAIASKLGLSDKIIQRASSSVRSDNKRFEDVISRLDSERGAMTAAKEEAQRLKAEFEDYKLRSEKAIKESREKAEEELAKAKEQARRTVEAARASADFVYAELAKAQKQKTKEERASSLEASRSAIKNNLSQYDALKEEIPDDGYELPRLPRIGEVVYVRKLKTNAVVKTSPDKNNILTVQSGVMTMKVSLSEIRLGDEYTGKAKEPKKKSAYTDITPRTIKSDIDLRGMNGEEAWAQVDLYLDEAKRCNLGQVTLIHGKGTGKLRDILRGILSSDSRVKSFREGAWGEGDAGVTVVELK